MLAMLRIYFYPACDLEKELYFVNIYINLRELSQPQERFAPNFDYLLCEYKASQASLWL